jgi:asparagine synthase (glutamine-hydrolysing)
VCGICGLVSLRGDPIDGAAVSRMNEALIHRGPDSDGSFVDRSVAFAMRRLAIIDLAGGDQPIANEDGTVHVIQNGEIYNYRELRRDLEHRGHRFATNSDTEVLVHLYEDRGHEFVNELRGMFAVALWDAKRRRLVLARDRFGIKPLYYTDDGVTLGFASELKALLRQPGFSREIDLDALEAFLAFSFVPAPLTIFRNARKLPPGSTLVWSAGNGAEPEITRYARPAPRSADDLRSEGDAELAEELRERLRDSVRAHLIADVPVGVLLSGGIDSAVLTALAALEGSERVRTFTIGFDEPGFDERAAARLIAERYDTDHHELVLKPDAAELLPALSQAFDEPFADSSAIPTYLVSQLARQHVKVALSGEGGDEFFGGYDYYIGHLLAGRFGRAAAALRPLIERLPTSAAKGSTMDWKAKRFVRGARLAALERHYEWKSVLSRDVRADLVRPERRGAADPLELLRSRYDESSGAEELARLMDVDLGIFLVDDMLAKTDRASMAHSLEARVPLLDPVVSELALSLPSDRKVRRFSKKRLLRLAATPLLPREILEGKKRGFVIPLAAWLRSDLEPFARQVLSPENVRKQGFFHPNAVNRLIDDHIARREDNSRKLWSLLTFSLWYERYGTNGSDYAIDRVTVPSHSFLR